MTVIAIYLIFLVFTLIAIKLIQWARKQSRAAYAFGAVTQMFLPDPYVQRTIAVVQENKAPVKKQKEHDGELKD
ncbi:hypothetical protein [Thalassomonas actiniarum]|uniref:Uncharacterized protein n=1 Tax=Thalassomonas actiniarum TaxID=485447 RepID=A0AAE9YPM8_9GAMM|nr:hypothetical protein [Thalassomonas actiniarum]WDD97226.1 hypothetical protein SG35_018005 [Thalassomonas actiniarum]